MSTINHSIFDIDNEDPTPAKEKPKFPIDAAWVVARSIVMTMIPHCHRIEIAGSIRRQKPLVGDIEIVYVPRIREISGLEDMFAATKIDQAEVAIKIMINQCQLSRRLNVKGHETWGPQIKLARHVPSGIPVDFFPIPEASWFNYLVCRTGPKESNVAICTAAQDKGWKWEPYSPGFKSLGSGEIIQVQSEREVFELVGLPYLPPHERK